MDEKPYVICQEWDLTAELISAVRSLDTNDLLVTTSSSRMRTCTEIIKGCMQKKWNLKSFCQTYGIVGEKLSCVQNFRLPDHLESGIMDQLTDRFRFSGDPVIRLQKIFGGGIMPIHVDLTRTASLVIPLQNHADTCTQFFRYQGPVQQLIDPSLCQIFDSVEISRPTLIDTKIPHNVVSPKKQTAENTRLSITLKWVDTPYQILCDQIY